MKCKKCKREIPENSIFCNWCGAKQIRDAVKIPTPKKTKTGYSVQIMQDGIRQTVTGKSIKDLENKVAAIRNGDVPIRATLTLKQLINAYIDANRDILSPTTIGSYEGIVECRFKDYIDKKVSTIDFQKMINDEKKAPKTVRNAWGLVKSALSFAKLDVPRVILPEPQDYDGDFLDHKQVITFLKAIKGNRSEAAALLALHSLRASELFHLTSEDIKDGYINVSGATVRVRGQGRIDKDSNKTKLSRRRIPIIIPRLLDLIPESGTIVTVTEKQAYNDVMKVCADNGLPICSLHDLRRTFASLAAYIPGIHEESICAMGGWTPGSQVVHKVYIKCSKTEIDEDAELLANYLQVSGTP